MIVGFNHNISYKGVGFHVQTEDSGLKSPHLVTLLYHGGTIIASQKTVYADILNVDNLQQVVEDLAKEQHKGMLRRLTQGEFDEKILSLNIPLEGVSPVKPAIVSKRAEAPKEELTPEIEEPLVEAEPVAAKVSGTSPVTIVEERVVDKFTVAQQKRRKEQTLDELIYAYLTGANEY
ncbi:hypothetical protein [Malonomonas rubra]|uniref:hypothetical protein n=1 Tax=Malonomonas rubra TaxID=57040 RepID=UPI0026F18D48|nr:hypothetical protein [Malonomonas rubra]